MRIFAALLLLGLASEGWAESGISGMLACNPNDKDKKPVLYAFDGEYLIRDNELAYPFQFLASLPNKNEIYFAYTHGQFHIDERNRRIKEAKKYHSRLQAFSSIDSISNVCNPEDAMFAPTVQALASHLNGTYQLDGGIKISDRNLTLSCEDIVTLETEKLLDLVPFLPVPIERLTHVKLTLNLSSMVVIEERYEPTQDKAISSRSENKRFVGEEYQCQSLGITAPEIDTSQSLTPIGRDL